MNQVCKVLVVDDEFLVRQGIKYVIDWEREGFSIVGEAANGQEALQAMNILSPHIVITDIVMPVMDGEELTRLVKRDYPLTEIIVLSSFSEFDYVRSSFRSGVVDYILKPKLEAAGLLAVLQKTRERITSLSVENREAQTSVSEQQSLNSLLSRLMLGYEMQQQDITLLDKQFPHEQFVLLGWESGRASANKAENIGVRILASVTDTLGRYCPGIVSRTILVELDAPLLLVNLQLQHWPEALRKIKEQAATLAEADPESELRWNVSRMFSGIRELAEVYQESYMKLRQMSFFYADRMLLVDGELSRKEAIISKFNLGHFTEQLKRRQLEEAFSDLHSYVSTLIREGSGDVFQFKSFLGNIIFNVATHFNHYKELEEGKYALFRAIDEAQYADEAVQVLDAFLGRVLVLTATSALTSGGNANMKKLLEYIEEHYAEPLTLTDLARHFHFNASYLSSLFTAHHREGFKEQLNKIRTEKAAALLRADETPISEISSRVGYGDHSYFCKVFKKYTGHSPSSYRRQYFGQE